MLSADPVLDLPVRRLQEEDPEEDPLISPEEPPISPAEPPLPPVVLPPSPTAPPEVPSPPPPPVPSTPRAGRGCNAVPLGTALQ
jgi:hypothetical protein